jgi:[protein-PII] uridylyltransferase
MATPLEYLAELGDIFAQASRVRGASDQPAVFEAAKEFIDREREQIYRMHFDRAGGTAVVARYTGLADALVRSLYSSGIGDGAAKASHTLVALGGYGRGELCFCSDIDIMFLYEGRLEPRIEALNNTLLYFLWDLGFSVGHSVRSTSEAIGLATLEETVLTSMLESRLLAGSKETFAAFTEKLGAAMESLGVTRFVKRTKNSRARVCRQAGADVYDPEPNIKNTAGGLRDYHAGIWIALARFGLKSPRDLFKSGLLTEEQFLKLERALDFMWKVRNQMHFDAGSPDDVLTLGRQEQFAHAFGFRASSGVLAVEMFMQDYYTHAAELNRFYKEMLRLAGALRRRQADITRGGKMERGLRIARRRVHIPAGDKNWFRENPARLFEIVWYAQKHGIVLSESAASSIRANVDLIDQRFRESPVARDYFLAILSDPGRVGATVRHMSDLGILDRFIPEFSAIRNIVRYHQFHEHPVDEHTLRALESLAAIPHLEEPGSNALKRILPEIRSPELLSLAILLHDFGKIAERDHAEAGEDIGVAIGKRLGLNADQTDTLRFLVRNHLKMGHLSQHRDIDDPSIIRAFASEVGSKDNLDMLYLLTFADLYAVRRGEWSDWKSALLYSLYCRTRDILERPDSAESEETERWGTPKAAAICEYSGNPAAVKEHLTLTSGRYFTGFPPKEIAEHIRMVSSLKRRTSAIKCVPVPGYSISQITVCTSDRRGLLADIVGTLASQRVSVLSASVFTRADGVAIDSFSVIDGKSEGALASTKWAVVKENLRRVLRGERSVTDLLRSAERRQRVAQRTMSSLRRSVSFDNAVSATHTIMDIEAPDRIGLLYDIASALHELGLNIDVARVATDARQAHDAFYITDETGGKVSDPALLQKIKARMAEVLGAGKTAQEADNQQKNNP